LFTIYDTEDMLMDPYIPARPHRVLRMPIFVGGISVVDD